MREIKIRHKDDYYINSFDAYMSEYVTWLLAANPYMRKLAQFRSY